MFKNIPFEVGNCVKFTIACHMLRFMRLGYFITAVIKYFYSHQLFVCLVSPSKYVDFRLDILRRVPVLIIYRVYIGLEIPNFKRK